MRMVDDHYYQRNDVRDNEVEGEENKVSNFDLEVVQDYSEYPEVLQ